MTAKRRILGVLNKAELQEIAEQFGLQVSARFTVADLQDVIAGSKRATIDGFLPLLNRDALKAACEEFGLSEQGREKQVLIARLLSHLSARRDPGESDSSLPIQRSTVDWVEPSARQSDRTQEVEEVSEDEELTHPYDPSQNNIITKSMSLDLLVKRLERDEIDLMPEFQRQGNLWDKQRMSRLIESLLIRLPLPVFYFDATTEGRWLVVDGLQRLCTLDQFVVKKKLRLQDLEYLSAFKGRGYDDLPRDMQRRIEETQIFAHMIQPGTPPAVKYNIFRRINTGGLALTAQEIRHALNPGKAGRFLAELSDLNEFKLATGGIEKSRMLDREFVLRFLSFSATGYRHYQAQSLDWFLTQQMAEMNRASEGEFDLLRTRFKLAMTTAYKIFGKHAFRKRDGASDSRRPINKALFESLSVGLGHLDQEHADRLVAHKHQLHTGFMKLLTDPKFGQAISQGTGDPNRVKLRFEAIETLIAETLESAE